MSLLRSVFCSRQLFNGRIVTGNRWFSSHETVGVSLEQETGLATITLSHPPVNSLNGEFLANISDTMKKLNADSSVSGILITSKFHGRVFSAGLNILDMFNKSDAHLSEFWRGVQEWYMDVFRSSKPIVAAINGHAPAGGCALSLMCDYRVMSEGKTIGLNETQLGIAAPFFFVDLMTAAVGRRQAEIALGNGSMYTCAEALKIGLVDEVCDVDSVIPRAHNKLLQLSKIPQPAYGLTKQQFRSKNIKELRDNREEDIATFVSLIQKPYVQKVIGKYLESLKQRKK